MVVLFNPSGQSAPDSGRLDNALFKIDIIGCLIEYLLNEINLLDGAEEFIRLSKLLESGINQNGVYPQDEG